MVVIVFINKQKMCNAVDHTQKSYFRQSVSLFARKSVLLRPQFLSEALHQKCL